MPPRRAGGRDENAEPKHISGVFSPPTGPCGDALPQLVIPAFITGLLTGLVVSAFRWLVDYPLTLWLGSRDGFEAPGRLDAWSCPSLAPW